VTPKRKDMPYVVIQEGGIIIWSSLAPWPHDPHTDYFILRLAHAWALGPRGAMGIYTPHKGWRQIGNEEWEAGR
jgi:hypothetical protein